MHKSITSLIPPENWGEDTLTEFFDKARFSAWATFTQEKYGCWVFSLIQIDKLFLNLIDSLNYNNQNTFEGLMLLSSHAAFRSSAEFAMQGRTAETMGLNRNVIEYGAYAIYFFANPELVKVWSTREDSIENRKAVKQNFTFNKMKDAIFKLDTCIGESVSGLYEKTIDLGAHPNESALFRRLLLHKNSDTKKVTMGIKYLQGGELAHTDTLRVTVETGITVLKCFGLIYSDEYKQKNLSVQLEQLKKLANAGGS